MHDPSSQSRLEHEQPLDARLDARAQTQPGIEFASPEEMLRHDAATTPPPPGLEPRVRESLAREAPALRSWWRRLLGR
ncbi:MAG: hypothetical protein H7A45_01085 [Verrucomicrobiales bacterium]|nr:hypothetical protein [Verrucomicrobiales bacterium]